MVWNLSFNISSFTDQSSIQWHIWRHKPEHSFYHYYRIQHFLFYNPLNVSQIVAAVQIICKLAVVKSWKYSKRSKAAVPNSENLRKVHRKTLMSESCFSKVAVCQTATPPKYSSTTRLFLQFFQNFSEQLSCKKRPANGCFWTLR